jgi:hypothetical protein
LKNRHALYLGEKDKDIVEYISPLLTRYDFSSVVRELIRDGIRYRQGAVPGPSLNVLQSSHLSQPVELEGIVLKEKELDPEEVDGKFDLL